MIQCKPPVTPWCNNLSLAGKRPVRIKLPLTRICKCRVFAQRVTYSDETSPLLWRPGVHSNRASSTGLHVLRILPALCPHHSRSLSAPFPQHLCSVTVLLLHFRSLSALSPHSFLTVFLSGMAYSIRSGSAVIPQCMVLHAVST